MIRLFLASARGEDTNMDHEITAEDIVDGEQVENLTTSDHFDSLATSVSMIGITYLALGKIEEAEAIAQVLDFIAWYASKQGITSEVLTQLNETVNARREALGSEKTNLERMGGDENVLNLLRGLARR